MTKVMNLEISIKICPALNVPHHYTSFITAQLQGAPDTVSHHHAPMGSSITELADWVANNIRHHIVARAAKMDESREQWLKDSHA